MKIFRQYKLPTLLNVLGFAIAMAAMYLFMTQVEFDVRFNRGIPNYDRIFRLEIKTPLMDDRWATNICRPFETLALDVPHVEAVQSIVSSGLINIVADSNSFAVKRMLFGNPGAAFFGLHMLAGTCQNLGAGEYVFTRSEAERVFGTIDCVGSKFQLPEEKAQTVTVVGVCEDMPANCMIPNGMLATYADKDLDNFSEWSYEIYVRLDATADAGETEQAIYKTIIDHLSDDDDERAEVMEAIKMRMTPITATHFSGASPRDTGNRNVLYVLLGGSLFMMLMVLLNITNFTLSQAPMRIRGINTRKVLGASNGSLRWMIVRDNIVLALLSLLLAAFLVYAFSQNAWCMGLMQGKVEFGSHPWLSLSACAVALMVAVISALYPAWYATSFAPAMVLKGSFALSPQGRVLRSAMLMMQFAIAIILVVYVLVMQSQAHYIFHADYGFNKDEVVIAQTSSILREKTDAVRTELEKLPCVESVGFGQYALGDNSAEMRWGRMVDGHQMSFYVMFVDPKFLSTLELPIMQGRDFRESDTSQGAYIVNEDMMRMYDFLKLDVPMFESKSATESFNFNYPIVGVCRNFKLRSMRKGNADMPVAFLLAGSDAEGWGNRLYTLVARIPAGQDKLEARRQIEQVLKKFDADGDFNLRFLDERLENTYRSEFRFINQVRVFAFLCIVITLFGVLSLTIFETEYRRKEIGIRKVMGSTEGEILRLFTNRYILPLLVSFVVGAPLAFLVCRRWLETYADHTSIHWWLFPLAFALVAAVVLLTVAIQSLRVARMNPVESIRTE